jgi:hypothetical protein
VANLLDNLADNKKLLFTGGDKVMQEKRARSRLKISMPVQVIGKNVKNELFREMCQTSDATAFGFRLP